jgi:hypothetical protein
VFALCPIVLYCVSALGLNLSTSLIPLRICLAGRLVNVNRGNRIARDGKISHSSPFWSAHDQTAILAINPGYMCSIE